MKNKKILFSLLTFIILLITLNSVSAGGVIDVSQDNFNRADNTLASSPVASNGNSWTSINGNVAPAILSNELYLRDAGTNSEGTLIFDKDMVVGDNFTFTFKSNDVSAVVFKILLYNSAGTTFNRIQADAGTWKLYSSGSTAPTSFTLVDNVEYDVKFYKDSSTTGRFYINGVDSGISFIDSSASSDIHRITFTFSGSSSSDYGYIDDLSITRAATNLSLNAKEAYTGTQINNFSVIIDGVDEYNTTTGSISTPFYYNDTELHNFSFYADGYANRTYTNINVSSDLEATLYLYNSIDVITYDQDTLNNISSFNVTMQSESNFYSFTTTDGKAEYSEIEDGTYNVLVTATNYSSAYYIVTVNASSHQFLYAYLSSTITDFIFTAKDKSTNSLLESVLITQKSFINGTLTTISTKYTDITGRAQFSYDAGKEYYFSTSKTGYEVKAFTLTILFDEYSILLTPLTITNATISQDDVYYINKGSRFFNGTSWLTLEFNSPLGQLENYSINITYSGNSSYCSDNNAVGSTINCTINTSSANFGETATARITYKSSVNNDFKTVTKIFTFTNFNPGAGAAQNFKLDTAGFSDISKVFWATLVLLVIMSLFGAMGYLVGDPILLGAVGGVLGFVLIGMAGFINWPVTGIGIFIMLIMIVGRLVNR